MAVTATGVSGISGTNDVAKDQALKLHFLDLSATDGLTALAGGAQAGTALSYAVNRFTVVATAGDSAQLPSAKAGRVRVVINADSADSMNVFPQTGEFINALSVDTAFAVAANKTAVFFCAVDGTWNSLLTS